MTRVVVLLSYLLVDAAPPDSATGLACEVVQIRIGEKVQPRHSLTNLTVCRRCCGEVVIQTDDPLIVTEGRRLAAALRCWVFHE